MPNSNDIGIKKYLDAIGVGRIWTKIKEKFVDWNAFEASIDGIEDVLEEKVNSNIIGAAEGLATLDSKGKLPLSQLPSLDYIPNTEKGVASGVATLDVNGKVPVTQIPFSDVLTRQDKGASLGVAELDASGKVPSSQLPSYVDDVVEYDDSSVFPETGEGGKIYFSLSNQRMYRWSGSQYVQISNSVALGTTAESAYRGDYGDAAYQHAVTNKGAEFAMGLYKIATNAEGHIVLAEPVTIEDLPEIKFNVTPDVFGEVLVFGDFSPTDPEIPPYVPPEDPEDPDNPTSGGIIETENGEPLETEDGQPIEIDAGSGTNSDGVIQTENGEPLETEDGKPIEIDGANNKIDGTVLTEDGDYLITEDGDYLLLEDSSNSGSSTEPSRAVLENGQPLEAEDGTPIELNLADDT